MRRQRLKEIDILIKNAKTESGKRVGLKDKPECQRNAKNLFEAQDDIDKSKETLLDEIEESLKQIVTKNELLFVRWRLR